MSYIFPFVLLLIILVFAYLTYKFRNPYRLIMVFGKKGSGKTTLLTKLALKALKRGHPVYSTVDVPGCITFNVDLVGKCSFPPDSFVFIDEVGMIWDNRDYKKFRTDVRDYFKLQRHYKNTVYLFSQTFDVDVKLRNLTDAMYLCTCHFGWLSMARRIRRMITIVNPQGDSESRIADSMEFVPLWLSLFGAGSVIFTFIPRWSRYFNSHEVPVLNPIKGKICPQVSRVPRQKLLFLCKNYIKSLFIRIGCSCFSNNFLCNIFKNLKLPNWFRRLCLRVRRFFRRRKRWGHYDSPTKGQ